MKKLKSILKGILITLIFLTLGYFIFIGFQI